MITANSGHNTGETVIWLYRQLQELQKNTKQFVVKGHREFRAKFVKFFSCLTALRIVVLYP